MTQSQFPAAAATGNVDAALSTKQRVEMLVRNVDSIVVLPEVATRIVAAVNDPRSSATQLQKIISHDPALVTRVLQMVNTSYYARRTKIDSVERAIVLLGFDAVHNIAISATFGQLFSAPQLSDDFGARDLWIHSVAVAAAAREMAKRFNKALAEPAFLAGLVHDIGLLVELQVCPDQLREICKLARPTDGRTFTELEYSRLGCNHAELGAALAERWGFPDFCRAVAAYHHMPALAEPEHRQLVALIYAADTLVCQDAIGFDLTAAQQLPDAFASNELVPLEVIEYAKENLPQLVSDAIIVFSE